jgi:hypothetical protein
VLILRKKGWTKAIRYVDMKVKVQLQINK